MNSDNFGYANISAGVRGTLVVQQWDAPRSRIEWRDRHGSVMGVAIEEFDGQNGVLDPGGRRLAFAGANPLDLFVRDMTSRVSTRLTFENQLVGSPVWSFDGRQILFARSASRGWETRAKAADGTGPDSLVFHGPGLFTFPVAWSRDGRWIVTLCSDPSGNFDFWRVPMTGEGTPEFYQQTSAQERTGSLSPDGHWLAYTADEGGKRSLYVQSFPTPGAKFQVTVDDALTCRLDGPRGRVARPHWPRGCSEHPGRRGGRIPAGRDHTTVPLAPARLLRRRPARRAALPMRFAARSVGFDEARGGSGMAGVDREALTVVD